MVYRLIIALFVTIAVVFFDIRVVSDTDQSGLLSALAVTALLLYTGFAAFVAFKARRKP